MKHISATIAAVLIVLTIPYATFAEDSNTGDTGAFFLLFPASTRNAAMAGTGVADDTDPINVIYNPANLALMRGAALQGSYTKWPFDITFLDAGIYGGTEYSGYEAYQSNIAAGIRYSKISQDTPAHSTVFLPDSTGRVLGDDWYVPITFAAAMTKEQTYFAGGATIKIANIGFEDESVQFTTFDFGIAAGASVFAREPYLFDLRGGVSWSNVSGAIEHGTYQAEPPEEFRAGLGFRFELIDSDFSRKRSLITIDVNTDFLDSQVSSGYLIGAELGVVETAFLRVGRRDEVFLNGGFSYGFGFQLKIKRVGIRADYAQTPAPLDEKADIFGLMIGTAF